MTAVGFVSRARVFIAAHGIARFIRVVTVNGFCQRSAVFARTLAGMRHQVSRASAPRRTARSSAATSIRAEEFFYARDEACEQHRSEALAVWNAHCNYPRPHTAAGNRPPASRLHAGVAHVMSSYN